MAAANLSNHKITHAHTRTHTHTHTHTHTPQVFSQVGVCYCVLFTTQLPGLTTAVDKEEGDGSIFTAKALSVFTEAAQRWRSENTQSLGRLWIQLLR